MRPMGTKLFYVNRRTDMTKVMVTSRSFVNAAKKACC
jgi:hypothetical protein